MNRIIPIVGIFALIIVGVILWGQLTGGDSPIITATESNTQQSEALSALLEMRTIKLDGRLFENRAFQSLVDTNREIVPEPVGRQNPFAPIGEDDVVLQDTNPQDTGDETFSE